MLTMRPHLRRTIGMTRGCVTWKKPSSVVSITLCQASLDSPGKAASEATPALFTTT